MSVATSQIGMALALWSTVVALQHATRCAKRRPIEGTFAESADSHTRLLEAIGREDPGWRTAGRGIHGSFVSDHETFVSSAIVLGLQSAQPPVSMAHGPRSTEAVPIAVFIALSHEVVTLMNPILPVRFESCFALID